MLRYLRRNLVCIHLFYLIIKILVMHHVESKILQKTKNVSSLLTPLPSNNYQKLQLCECSLFLLQSHFQESDLLLRLKHPITFLCSAVGACLTTIEILCYIFLYSYITLHNRNIAGKIVKPSVIKSRNRSNAISLSGQLTGWTMEIWYIIFVGFISTIFKFREMREVVPFLKQLEFVLVPLVQVYTSAPIRNFIAMSKD